MGEKSTNEINQTTSYMSSLPPGCRFYPSDEQLLCYYLASKNNNTINNDDDDGGGVNTRSNGIDVIKEINLYNFDPFDLPETACFRFGRGGRRRHWYCYVTRVLDKRGKRRAGSGFWKKMGRVRDVVGAGAGKVVVGTRKTFVFYLGGGGGDHAKGSGGGAVRTQWLMYEYALLDHPKASFVLCRVFVKSHHGNNLSDHVLSSCAEESVATVRHIGVQCDGTVTAAIAEAKPHDDNAADCDNESLKYPKRQINELNDCIASWPSAEQMGSNGQMTLDATIEALTAEELIAIAEGDFLELDDLLCPLPGID